MNLVNNPELPLVIGLHKLEGLTNADELTTNNHGSVIIVGSQTMIQIVQSSLTSQVDERGQEQLKLVLSPVCTI